MSTFLNKISIQDKRNRLCLYNLKEDQLNKIADFLKYLSDLKSASLNDRFYPAEICDS
jgi:hypothetical protein